MRFTDKKLLLFDLDGTLIDSGGDLVLSVNYMLQTLGRSKFSAAVIHEWIGNGASTLVKRALTGKAIVDENIDDLLVEEALDIFLNYYKENVCVKTILYPHVKTTLKELQERGYILTIITNKPFAFIQPILKKLEILDFFETFIGADSLAKCKPEPEPLLYICKTLHVSTDNALMIGDSKNDILAAKAAKIDSIGVNYGFNYGENIQTYEPELVIESFEELLKVLP